MFRAEGLWRVHPDRCPGPLLRGERDQQPGAGARGRAGGRGQGRGAAGRGAGQAVPRRGRGHHRRVVRGTGGPEW